MTQPPNDELRLSAAPLLDEVLDRATLGDLCRAFFDTFELPVRIVTGDERVLAAHGADAGAEAGGRERHVSIDYAGHRLGTLVVGPERAGTPRDDLDKLTQYLSRVLDVLLFSGHRAHLASTLHLASAEASYRELAEKNERLQHAYDRLKELDRLKSNFLATMSHELRTPLTSIIGYSEMLGTGMGGELNEAQREFVDTIRAKSDQLLELILTLLDVAKLEQDQVHLKLASIDPAELALDVLRTIGPAAAKKGIRVEHHIESRLPRVRADKTRLRQVLLNLLDNALKFTPRDGTVRLEVAPGQLTQPGADEGGLVLLGAPEPAVRFLVRDSGIGIAPSEHARIFDAFYQVDGSATREYGGTGLGLSIVKRLVDAHGGTIELASAPGEGSEFRVQIPVAER